MSGQRTGQAVGKGLDGGPVVDALPNPGDHDQQPDAWARKAVFNVAHSGRFSSDRTITDYAVYVWGARPCPVD